MHRRIERQSAHGLLSFWQAGDFHVWRQELPAFDRGERLGLERELRGSLAIGRNIEADDCVASDEMGD